MGLDIKRNKKGLYSVKSSISDEQIGEKWMTEDEFKKILIERAYWRFVEETIRIEMEFPSGYYINDRYETIDDKHVKGSEFILKNWNKDNAIDDKYREILKRLNIEL